MSEVIVTRGLPGSGKSTWAKDWVAVRPDQRVRVSRDDIRFALFGKYRGKPVDEDLVSSVEAGMVAAAVKRGKDVVIDSVHLKASYVKKWAALYDITLQEFPVPVETAIDRDWARNKSVGEGVIRSLAQRFHIPEKGTLPKVDLTGIEKTQAHRPYVPGTNKAYSFDIDGTLSLMTSGRSPYDTSRYDEDTPNWPILTTLWALQDAARSNQEQVSFIGLSGRSEDFALETIEWLHGWGIQLDYLFMRPSGDTRNDAIVKSELVDKHISGVYDVTVHFDDRQRVVDALREKGMTVAQVAPGNF